MFRILFFVLLSGCATQPLGYDQYGQPVYPSTSYSQSQYHENFRKMAETAEDVASVVYLFQGLH